MEKTCNTCKEVKPLEEFKKDKRIPGGYGGQCSKCARRRKVSSYDPDDLKQCHICHEIKKHSEFKTSSRTVNGVAASCTICYNKIKMERHHKAKPGSKKKRAKTMRSWYLKNTYGLTLEDYDRMFKEQNGLCFICLRPNMRTYFAIDHCHTTGRVRGLLCDACNQYIGYIKEDLKALERIKTYLTK